MNIGVIGNGFVGRATQIFGKAPGVTLHVYDIDPSKCVPTGTTMTSLAECDLIFICVPTPFDLKENRCDTSIVESVVGELMALQSKAGIICRSTVPPGTCAALKVAHMPEYLTERNWHRDFINTSVWELGLPATQENYENCAITLQRLLTQCKTTQLIASDALVVRDSSVTEMAKLMRNSMLAVRVAVCNEYEEFCRTIGIDYEEVRKLATADPRIGSSHTQVPGPDGKRGFGGTCLPKDLKALIGEMTRSGVNPLVLTACCNRNDCVDRCEQDWMQSGRSVSVARK